MSSKNELNVFTYSYLPWTRVSNWFNNIKQFFTNIKLAYQRATKGYCDYDVWNLDTYLTYLLRDSIKYLAEHSHSYPGRDAVDTPEKWETCLLTISNLLDRSIERTFEENQYYKNPFEDEYEKYLVSDHSIRKENADGSITYIDNSTPEQDELCKAYFAEEKHIYDLRVADREKAFKMILKYYDNLWD